jgi:hypothetical protein
MLTLVKLGIAGVVVIAASAVVDFAVDDSTAEREPAHRPAAASAVWLDRQASKPHPTTGSSPGAADPPRQAGQPPRQTPPQQAPRQAGPQQPSPGDGSGQQGPGQAAEQGDGTQGIPPAPDGGPNCDLGAPCDSHYGPPRRDGPSNVGPGPDEAPYQPPGSAGDRWARDQYCFSEGLPPGCI